MNRTSSLLLIVLALFGLLSMGCSTLVPFTQELRSANNLSKDDLKNLQFYTSERITLRREVDSGGSQVTGAHKLVLVSGKTIEEVVIAAKTPGVAVDVDDGSLAVSFEPGTSLLFSAAGEPVTLPSTSSSPQTLGFAEPPNPFPGNGDGVAHTPDAEPQSLGHGSVGGSYWLALSRGGAVPFGKKTFFAVDGTPKAHLLIDAQSLEEVVKSRKVLGGMRLAPK